MKRISTWTGIALCSLALLWALGLNGKVWAGAQNTQATPQIKAEEKAQLDQLAQLDAQLQKSRDALHAAINDFGLDSDEADAARVKLTTDRAAYRKLRRSLVVSGVEVPPPTGFATGNAGDRPGFGRSQGRGRHPHCRHCDQCRY